MALPSGTGSGAYNAGDENDRHSRLFPVNSAVPFTPWSSAYSATFSVVDAPVVIRAYDLPENSIACLEMVTGCKDGDTFSGFCMGGRCWCLCPGNNALYLPFEGRYRLRLYNADPRDVTVTILRTAINVDLGRLFEMSCNCPTPFDPLAAAQALADTPAAMDILSGALLAQDVVAVIVSDPLALTTLCTSLTPCVSALIEAAAHAPAVITGDTVIQVVGNPDQQFNLAFDPTGAVDAIVGSPAALAALKQAMCDCHHAPAQISSPLGTITVLPSGLDGQTFEIDINLPTVFPQAPAQPVTNDPMVPTTFYGGGNHLVRPDGFFSVAGKLVPFIN